jgi:hypothetical protein
MRNWLRNAWYYWNTTFRGFSKRVDGGTAEVKADRGRWQESVGRFMLGWSHQRVTGRWPTVVNILQATLEPGWPVPDKPKLSAAMGQAFRRALLEHLQAAGYAAPGPPAGTSGLGARVAPLRRPRGDA